MTRKSSHTSHFSSTRDRNHFDDEEITADYNVNDLGELPPTPVIDTEDLDFDILKSITNLDQKDVFRALHQSPAHPDASQAIAVAVNHKDLDEDYIASVSSGSLIKPQESDSLHIEIAVAENSASLEAISMSEMSVGSRQSIPAESIGSDESSRVAETESSDAGSSESATSSQQEPAADILWKCQSPLLELRGITLLHSDKVLLHDVNLDIGNRGIYVIVCEEAFYRKLLLTLLSGTNRGANVRLEGHARFAGETLGTKYYPQFCAVSASELLMTLRVFMCRNLGDEIAAQIPTLFAEMGLAHLAPQLDNFIHTLETHERRAVALLRAFLGSSPLLCVDDPFDGLKEGTGNKLLSTIRKLSSSRAVLVMAPTLGPFKLIADGVAYFRDGILAHDSADPQAENPVAQQIPTRSASRAPAAPATAVGITVGIAAGIAAGSAARTELPKSDPKTKASSSATHHKPISPEVLSPQQPTKKSSRTPQTTNSQLEETPRGGSRPVASGQQGPRGFRWLVEGSLAGTPEPGILFDIDYDLTLLRSAGITMLVTLTEQPLPESLLETHGLKSLFFPIVDMNVPSCRATEDLCALVEIALERGEVIAFHCKAGLGRTGTLLVSYLIWEGAPPSEALEVARSIEPGWVQSSIQEQYLFEFAAYCQHKRSGRSRSS